MCQMPRKHLRLQRVRGGGEYWKVKLTLFVSGKLGAMVSVSGGSCPNIQDTGQNGGALTKLYQVGFAFWFDQA